MIIPEEAGEESPEQFCHLLKSVSDKYAFYIRNSKHKYKENSEQKLAVSSVIKFLVAALIYE